MKRTIVGFVILFGLSACSLNDVLALFATPTAPAIETLTPTVFYTPSYTPTITPTPPTPTYTATPTPVGLNSADEDAPVFTPFPTSTPAPQTSVFLAPGSLFVSVSVSSDTLYWGYCDDPHYVDFDVRLANNLRVKYVLLFMRLEDKGGNQSTAWGGGAIMQKVSKNSTEYTYRVRPENIAYYEEFKDAWIEYQVVVATSGLGTLARTPVYRTNLSLKWCRPIEVNE
ncbi:MAG: membrane lipoprotein lipid attachment site-containing protein [Anaerolineales bacterium]|nr:membrane lipoprotein lipid attachment site-containing protein [Anaerolineales bacterium]